MTDSLTIAVINEGLVADTSRPGAAIRRNQVIDLFLSGRFTGKEIKIWFLSFLSTYCKGKLRT